MKWSSALAWTIILSSCGTLQLAGHAEEITTSDGSREWVNVRRSQPVMGTFVLISAWGHNRPGMDDAISKAFSEIHRMDSKLSLHRTDSELSLLNQCAGAGWRRVSPELFEVLTLAQDIAEETQGAFDVTIRPLADLWGFIWKEYRLPTPAELQAVLPKVNWRLVELDQTNQSVRFLDQHTSIDLGGIGKGYAVDRAIQTLTDHGVMRALVRAGGDLRVSGAPPDEDGWTIQLEDPAKLGNRTFISMVHQAVSTSGNYENFFEVNGQRYSHLLDPRTGLPVANLAACSLIATTCAESDAWATACFILGPDKSLDDYADQFGFKFSIPPNPEDRSWAIRRSARFPIEHALP